MPERLFSDDCENLTEQGHSIDTEVALFFSRLFRECYRDEVSLRDAELIAVCAVHDMAAEARLRYERKKGLV